MVMVMKPTAFRRGIAAANSARGMLTPASRSQYFLPGVFHLELVAHWGGICLRDHHILCRVMHEVRRAHDHWPLTIDHVLHVLTRDALILFSAGRWCLREGWRSRVIVILASWLLLIYWIAPLRGFNLLLRVFETFQVSKVIDLFRLSGFAARIYHRNVIGLKLHKWRINAWSGLNRRRGLRLLLSLRVLHCLLLV